MAQNKPHAWSYPRAHARYVLDVRIIVRAKEALHGRTKDIAEGGLGATIPGNIEVGDVVELELQLPGSDEPLKLKAEVRYRQGFQYGFRFLHATQEQKETIRRTTPGLSPAL
jgi:hypothetical protein